MGRSLIHLRFDVGLGTSTAAFDAKKHSRDEQHVSPQGQRTPRWRGAGGTGASSRKWTAPRDSPAIAGTFAARTPRAFGWTLRTCARCSICGSISCRQGPRAADRLASKTGTTCKSIESHRLQAVGWTNLELKHGPDGMGPILSRRWLSTSHGTRTASETFDSGDECGHAAPWW
jgi:hypothetical protein